ncbi:hypothetical protein EV368DRAFT_67732 [Lentinula lateritia]|uniref:Uncharacterized protein n=1 Tax=Lentinula aff. lateritia TaxID=2804960 RepID=A0ACC1TRZ1_9AGAR|nr:hypothetical protein F5876DRAFT_68042 [Lentinula aff. lateritia]KAJ3849077.1 hypothetical protein EV368DRAFT_67732 [Lentinula lateritia]
MQQLRPLPQNSTFSDPAALHYLKLFNFDWSLIVHREIYQRRREPVAKLELMNAADTRKSRAYIYIKFDQGTSAVQASTLLLRSQIDYVVESWKPGWKSDLGNVKFEFKTYLDTNDDRSYTARISGKPIGPQCLQYKGKGVATILKGKEVLHTANDVPAGVPTTGGQLYIDFGTVNRAPRRDLLRLFRSQIIHTIQSWKKTWDSASDTLMIRNYPERVTVVLEQDLAYSALISGNSISPECTLTKHSCRIDYQGSGVAKILDGEGNLLHTVMTVPVWAEDQLLVFAEP